MAVRSIPKKQRVEVLYYLDELGFVANLIS
jgi:hypothetical protein